MIVFLFWRRFNFRNKTFNLYNYVDEFVICKAARSCRNNKELNFNIEKFKQFRDKINYIVIDDLPKEVKKFKKNWHPAHARDQFQRNALVRGIDHCDDDDLIMISDLDEIPNPEKISSFGSDNNYACFVQNNHLLNLIYLI